ncbi:hypothetical protein [Streptomyces sp. CA-132043]|uniref:hypothetical protein n=1 Tax=Streptomyces sp. CA-132043 TaxID=3240048 RepID=UPI003D93E090
MNAEVTRCRPDASGEGVHCFGNWTVDGIHEVGRRMPVNAEPGSTVRINVSRAASNVAYARLSDDREALGLVVGTVGVLVTGASLFELIATRGRIRRGLDDVIAGRATVSAQVLTVRPRLH